MFLFTVWDSRCDLRDASKRRTLTSSRCPSRQAHLIVGQQPSDFAANLKRFTDLGLEVRPPALLSRTR